MSFVQERGKLTALRNRRISLSDVVYRAGNGRHTSHRVCYSAGGAGQAEERYIFSELYQIEPCCVYVDKTFVQVKLVFQPARVSRKRWLSRWRSCCAIWEKRCGVEGAVYAENAAEIVQSDGYGRVPTPIVSKICAEKYTCVEFGKD